MNQMPSIHSKQYILFYKLNNWLRNKLKVQYCARAGVIFFPLREEVRENPDIGLEQDSLINRDDSFVSQNICLRRTW